MATHIGTGVHGEGPTPTDVQYGSTVQPPQPGTGESGTLPFSGLDAGLFALVAVVLIGSGAVLRVLGRRH